MCIRDRLLVGLTSASDNNTAVLAAARKLLTGTFNAGGGYADIWARDTNTFISIAMDANPSQTVQSVLLGFFCRQKSDGECPGGYTPHPNQSVCTGAAPPVGNYESCLGGTEMCKNNAETDQETSIVLGVHKYVTKSNDTAFLSLDVNGTTVLRRCERALQWLREHRTDASTGLLWGGTTLDWGDVQPEPDVADVRLLDPGSHPAIDVYDNAMFVLAVEGFIELSARLGQPSGNWTAVLQTTRNAIRTHLWSGSGFIPHLYMDAVSAAQAATMAGLGSFKHGSPFAASFNESALNYHGGPACAGMAGVLSSEELQRVLQGQLADVAAVNAAGGDVTIGLTIYPPYPDLKVMARYTYQNGGDWAWFGGRMVMALVKYGLLEEAEDILKPMVDRVVQHGGFWEWWEKDGSPSGSNLFHGSAGVLGQAIVELQTAQQKLMVTTTDGV
eukprot:TRINITY_DN3506_c0_g2_i1.p1 TRINITY_DN3506_c0_g2~~TRINITY_DN3506_c0_g2_i1.p1  ORF type:complete len:444 (+),score=81.92 TRINITY_DN3506_c0_g2_i1:114-1445(+)